MSRRLMLAMAALAVTALGLTPGAGVVSSGAQPDDETVDFIRFNGAVYLAAVYLQESAAAPNPALESNAVGPAVGQVVTNWVDATDQTIYANEPCYWETPDGTAPRLMPGDAIYAVRGYATTFRIAAQQGDGFVFYQAWCNDDAEVGADLFDISRRVERISVTGDVSESTGWTVIDDHATVQRLVDMLLDGRVIPEELASTAPVTYQMIFHLDDGTAFRASAAEGEVLWGLGAVTVPRAFTQTLARVIGAG